MVIYGSAGTGAGLLLIGVGAGIARINLEQSSIGINQIIFG